MKLFLLIIFAMLTIAFAKRKSRAFEGDIDLSGKPIQAYAKKFERGNDHVFDPNVQRYPIKGEIYRWRNGVIPYEISNDFASHERNIILSAIDDFNQKTCIRWIPLNRETNYVSIKKSDDGCLSPIGMQGGQQFLDIGIGCMTKGRIIHEMMHSLGFIHEQSRLDRDKYVKINWDNINKDTGRRAFDKFELEIEDLGFPYDYGSIMHYGSTDFGKHLGFVTVQPKDRSANIGQRIELSIIDAKKVNKRYKCSNFDISDAKEGGSSSGVSRGPVGNGNCVDTDYDGNNSTKQCDKWAKDGLCFSKKYESFMKIACSKTCMYCGSCENIYENKYCQFYKDSGYCSKFKKIMSYRCMKTCDKCFI